VSEGSHPSPARRATVTFRSGAVIKKQASRLAEFEVEVDVVALPAVAVQRQESRHAFICLDLWVRLGVGVYLRMHKNNYGNLFIGARTQEDEDVMLIVIQLYFSRVGPFRLARQVATLLGTPALVAKWYYSR
jgi:hypothetical protein